MSLSTPGADLIKIFPSRISSLLWNKGMWLAIASHVTTFNQSVSIILEFCSWYLWDRLQEWRATTLESSATSSMMTRSDIRVLWSVVFSMFELFLQCLKCKFKDLKREIIFFTKFAKLTRCAFKASRESFDGKVFSTLSIVVVDLYASLYLSSLWISLSQSL